MQAKVELFHIVTQILLVKILLRRLNQNLSTIIRQILMNKLIRLSRLVAVLVLCSTSKGIEETATSLMSTAKRQVRASKLKSGHGSQMKYHFA